MRESEIEKIVKEIAEEIGKQARVELLVKIVETAKEKETQIKLFMGDTAQYGIAAHSDGAIYYVSSNFRWERASCDVEHLANLPEISKVLNEFLATSEKAVVTTY